MTQETRFWYDLNFDWYIAVSKVNTALMSGHFQNSGVVQPSLYFQIYLAIKCLDNTIGVELMDIILPKRTSKIPIYVPCEKIKLKHHGRMWDLRKEKWNKWNRNIKGRSFRTIKNVVKIPGYIVSVQRIYSCAMDAL